MLCGPAEQLIHLLYRYICSIEKHIYTHEAITDYRPTFRRKVFEDNIHKITRIGLYTGSI